jgi:chromosome segregation ATPase
MSKDIVLQREEPVPPDNEGPVGSSGSSSVKQKLFQLLLTPAVFTVLLTVVIGPFSVGLVNDFIKNKEIDSERKKHLIALQTDILTRVFTYTYGADFNAESSIEKIKFMAKMLDENRDIFDLQFGKTMTIIEKYHDDRLRDLEQNTQARIDMLQRNVSADSAKLLRLNKEEVQLKGERDERETEIRRAFQRHTINEHEMNEKLTALHDSVAIKEERITGLAQSIALTKENISSISREKDLLVEQIRAKEEANQKQAQAFKEVMQRATDLVGEKESNIKELHDALEASRNKLAEALTIIAELRTNVKDLQQKVGSQPSPVDSTNKPAELVSNPQN